MRNEYNFRVRLEAVRPILGLCCVTVPHSNFLGQTCDMKGMNIVIFNTM